MYTLYIGNKNYSSWSLRPWLLMKELGIAFEERLQQFEDHGSYQKFRSFSPTGLVPCLVDKSLIDDSSGSEQTVWESLGITEYLAEAHPQVWPEEVGARAWARSAAAEMHAGFSALRNECPMNVGLRIDLNELTAALKHDTDRLVELWEQGLRNFGGPFLAGDRFTAVDAFFAPVAYRIQTYGLPISTTCAVYVEQILNLAGMQVWTEAGLAETFREADHEIEFLELGTITADFRSK